MWAVCFCRCSSPRCPGTRSGCCRRPRWVRAEAFPLECRGSCRLVQCTAEVPLFQREHTLELCACNLISSSSLDSKSASLVPPLSLPPRRQPAGGDAAAHGALQPGEAARRVPAHQHAGRARQPGPSRARPLLARRAAPGLPRRHARAPVRLFRPTLQAALLQPPSRTLSFPPFPAEGETCSTC